jgi:hypothetical protein
MPYLQSGSTEIEHAQGDAARKDEGMKLSTRNWRDISILCFLGSALFYVFSRTSADPDLWGHIRFGEDLWRTGKIVRQDIYSYLTGDQLWINHEWLSEAIFYAVFAGAGSAGLIVFKSCLSLLIVGIIYCHLRQQVSVALRAAILALVFTMSLIPYSDCSAAGLHISSLFACFDCPRKSRSRGTSMALVRATFGSLCSKPSWGSVS